MSGRALNFHASGYLPEAEPTTIPERYRGPGNRLWKTLVDDLSDGRIEYLCINLHLIIEEADAGPIVARSEPFFFPHKDDGLTFEPFPLHGRDSEFVTLLGYNRFREACAQIISGFAQRVLPYILFGDGDKPSEVISEREEIIEKARYYCRVI